MDSPWCLQGLSYRDLFMAWTFLEITVPESVIYDFSKGWNSTSVLF